MLHCQDVVLKVWAILLTNGTAMKTSQVVTELEVSQVASAIISVFGVNDRGNRSKKTQLGTTTLLYRTIHSQLGVSTYRPKHPGCRAIYRSVCHPLHIFALHLLFISLCHAAHAAA